MQVAVRRLDVEALDADASQIQLGAEFGALWVDLPLRVNDRCTNVVRAGVEWRHGTSLALLVSSQGRHVLHGLLSCGHVQRRLRPHIAHVHF